MLFHLNRVPELSWLCWKTQDVLLLHFLPSQVKFPTQLLVVWTGTR